MPMQKKEFNGKVILITGGARNIGLAVAEAVGLGGARVALADICHDIETAPYAMSSRQDLDDAVARLRKQGVDAIGKVCDVREEEDVQSLVGDVIGTFGRIDMLVNNAGLVSLLPVTDMSLKAWRDITDTCLTGAFLCCREVVRHMIHEGGGRIVNVSSVAGLRGLGLGAHYCAAKHGLIGLTRALALEFADRNITVNAVCPGTTTSTMLEGLARQIELSDEPYRHFSQQHHIKGERIAPQDIAGAICWLLSDAARFVTGVALPVDAGWTSG